jgi:ribosomal 30S subunit maturation factor RimM
MTPIPFARIQATHGRQFSYRVHSYVVSSVFEWALSCFARELHLSYEGWKTKLHVEVTSHQPYRQEWLMRLGDIHSEDDAAYFLGHYLSVPANAFELHAWQRWSSEQKLLFLMGRNCLKGAATFWGFREEPPQVLLVFRWTESRDRFEIPYVESHITEIDLERGKLRLIPEVEALIQP